MFLGIRPMRWAASKTVESNAALWATKSWVGLYLVPRGGFGWAGVGQSFTVEGDHVWVEFRVATIGIGAESLHGAFGVVVCLEINCDHTD